MNEYRCGKCGWTAKAKYPQGILAAADRHAQQGCEPSGEEKP
jgi:hypothetical protein